MYQIDKNECKLFLVAKNFRYQIPNIIIIIIIVIFIIIIIAIMIKFQGRVVKKLTC